MPSLTEFSKAYQVKPNTIRRWCSEFADYLSHTANPAKGKQRTFTHEDGEVIALIGDMRSDNASYETIHAALAAGERGQWPPMRRHEETGQDYQEQDSNALVTRLTAELAHTSGELNAVKEERDYLRDKLESTQHELRDAEKQAALLQGKIETLEELSQKEEASQADPERPSFWQRLRGKG